MKRKTYLVVLSVVMVAFLSTIFLANANPAFAASGKNKSQTPARTNAVEQTEAQIKQLQGALKITEPQQELWNNLTQVMRENAKDMDTFREERAENTKTMNAVDRMKMHSQVTETHLGQINKLLPPFEAFYNSLSHEQKQTTDEIFRTGKHGKHKRK
jgi:hypothetical protein